MPSYKIGVVVGSLRSASLNRQFATAIARMAPVHISFAQIDIGDLPQYDQDDDADQAAPVKRFKAEIAACHGIVFVTPEYNRSIPGVLKNAIDHASRPYGQNAWMGKPASVLGVSIGAPGASMAQQHLRNVLAYLDMPTLGQPEMFIQAKDGLFDETGGVGKESAAFVQQWMDAYIAWVELHSPAR